MFPKARPPVSEYGALLFLSALFLLTVIFGAFAGWFGCVSAELASRVGTVESDVAHVHTQIAAIAQQAGRDVNEPVTGWILAVGYALTGVATITAYTVMHRSKMFRGLKDKVRGRHSYSGGILTNKQSVET